MGTVRKLRRPYFVSAEVMKDGTVTLITSEHDEYRVEMDRERYEPIVGRLVSLREMAEARLKAWREKEALAHRTFGRPKLVE